VINQEISSLQRWQFKSDQSGYKRNYEHKEEIESDDNLEVAK
jgi:hypothetical protein